MAKKPNSAKELGQKQNEHIFKCTVVKYKNKKARDKQ